MYYRPSFDASHHLAANNWPLRGSKGTDFEGGVRVAAFVSGGFLGRVAPNVVGQRLGGIIHIADWYATLCALAGVDPTDDRATRAGLPPIDSKNQWPYLTGQVHTSARATAHLSSTAYINGSYKIITGNSGTDCWGGQYPWLYP